jgi:ATP-dependent RNA helicase RhlE
LRTVVLFGGAGYGKQNQDLRQGADILVATPGRLLDHLQRGTLRLNKVEMVVLDEADRMLDMGFLPDVRRILERCPRNRQTLLFSATIPPEIERLCQWALRNPETVEIGQRRSPAETVTHALYPVAIDQKQALLDELLKRTDFDQVLIFCRTKHGADRVARRLQQQGHAVTVLHSNRTQRERESALNGFRDGRYEIMVATDIAARGIDVEQISHVINYDVPHHPEDYVHRIGRTGRAQSVGDAFTIMTGEDVQEVAAIEHFIGQKIPRVKLEGFKYEYTRLLDAHPAPVFGARRKRGRWA